jgi:SAM-dependent methyltransferase
MTAGSPELFGVSGRKAAEVDHSCPLCSALVTSVYLCRNRRHENIGCEAFGASRTDLALSDILLCEECNFGFAERGAIEKDLAAIYENIDESVYESEDRGRWVTAARHLRIVHRYARPPGSLLDVGCASGRFLRLALDAGWQVSGVEPSKSFIRRAVSLLAGCGELMQSTFEDAKFNTPPFDVITMWDVLEHVPDPKAFLARARSLLTPRGRLFVKVPNLKSTAARVLRSRWPLLLPEHLNYFTRNSLRLCAQKAGLQVIAFRNRPVSVSLDYLFFRLGQHGFSVAEILHRALSCSRAGRWTIPVFYGECYAIMAPQSYGGRLRLADF